MDSFQLRCALLKCIRNSRSFVCAKNQLHLIKSRSFCIIVNTQDSYLPGLHWLAIYKSRKNNYIDFFDSLGNSIFYYGGEIIEFLKAKGGLVRYNNCKVQSNNSNACGMYCLYFLIKRDKGVQFVNILNHFSSSELSTNDLLVKKYVRDIFKFPVFNKCKYPCNCNVCKTSPDVGSVCHKNSFSVYHQNKLNTF